MKDEILYKISRPVIRVLFNFFYKPTYIGRENIPSSGSFVLAGNHTSYLDPLLLMSVSKRTIHFLAKDSLVKGVKGLVFKHMGIIPVNRKIHDKDALRNAKEALNNKKVIGILTLGDLATNESIDESNLCDTIEGICGTGNKNCY